MFAFGFFMGVMDVSMNSCGVLTELVADETYMGAYHGSYSVAAALGSLLGGALTFIDATTVIIFAVVAVISVVMSVLAWLNGYPFDEELDISKSRSKHSDDNRSASDENSLSTDAYQNSDTSETPVGQYHETDQSCWQQLQSLKCIRDHIFFLCAVGFLASYGEGGIVTWSVVYFMRYITEANLVSSLGFFAFYVTMALGRFSCDYLRQRYGRDRIAKVSGFLSLVGLVAVIFAPSLTDFNKGLAVAVGTIGFAITGCGLSTLIPTMFSTAGHLTGRHSGSAIATVAAFTYCGSIVSSPMIGGLSDAFHSLRYAFIVVALLLFAISPLGLGIPQEDHAHYLADGKLNKNNKSSLESQAYTPLLGSIDDPELASGAAVSRYS